MKAKNYIKTKTKTIQYKETNPYGFLISSRHFYCPILFCLPYIYFLTKLQFRFLQTPFKFGPESIKPLTKSVCWEEIRLQVLPSRNATYPVISYLTIGSKNFIIYWILWRLSHCPNKCFRSRPVIYELSGSPKSIIYCMKT